MFGLSAILGFGSSLLKSSSERKAQAANAANIASTNAANLAESKEARAFAKSENELAYKRNVAAVEDGRRYDTKTQLEAEARALKYADPSYTRERLEAAGYNPLTGAPAPVGGGIVDTARAGSQIAQAQATSAGAVHQNMAHVVEATASPLGLGLAAAASAVDAYEQKTAEQALQKSQIQAETDRLSRILNNSSLRPTVEGPYQSGGKASAVRPATKKKTEQTGLAPTLVNEGVYEPPERFNTGFTEVTYTDRETRLEPGLNMPATMDIQLPSGRVITGMNSELDLEGPAAYANSGWIVGATVLDGSSVAAKTALNWDEKSQKEAAEKRKLTFDSGRDFFTSPEYLNASPEKQRQMGAEWNYNRRK